MTHTTDKADLSRPIKIGTRMHPPAKVRGLSPSSGKEVRLYYLQIEKEWKAEKSDIPQVSAEQVEAFMFQKDVFTPWVQDHPIAADVFLGWQGIQPSPIAIAPVTAIEPTPVMNPSIEAQKALDGAFLNLNRSGLMMNKLFHFLDRIPTMKTLDEDFVNEMVKGLEESERVQRTLRTECVQMTSRADRLAKENKRLTHELRETTLELEALQRVTDIVVPVSVATSVYQGRSPLSLKPAI